MPPIRNVSFTDVGTAIAQGIRDYARAPQYGLVLAGLYVIAGWLLIVLVWVLDLKYLAYPLAMGFALIAPFAAVGFYAVSRGLERGEPLTWQGVFGAVREAAGRDLRWMALVTGFALVIWLDLAAILYFMMMGFNTIDAAFFEKLVTTSQGLTFLFVGNALGAAIALAVFSISAVSFPMLFDRDVDFVTAMVTSVRFVLANLAPMACWCAIIGATVTASVLVGFLGLLLVMPVIGHATWHLYRMAVGEAPAADTQGAGQRGENT